MDEIPAERYFKAKDQQVGACQWRGLIRTDQATRRAGRKNENPASTSGAPRAVIRQQKWVESAGNVSVLGS